MTNQIKPVTYRMIHFPKVDRWIGMAWNYDLACLFSTTDRSTYTAAREALAKAAAEVGAELRWFDGEYSCDTRSDALTPMSIDWQVGHMVRTHSGTVIGEVQNRYYENGTAMLTVLDGMQNIHHLPAAEFRRYAH